MATSTTGRIGYLPALHVDWHTGLALVLNAALPLAAFAIVNGIAEANGNPPLYFSPMGLPGWLGATLHLVSLPLFGIARWLVATHGPAGHKAGWWVVALIAGTIIFPFIVMPLDSVQLSMVAMGLFLLGLAAVVRVGAIEPRAAAIMAPGLAWMGFSALVGLSFAAAWAPPFAVTNSHSAS